MSNVMELDAEPTLNRNTLTGGAQALSIPPPNSLTNFIDPNIPQLYPLIPLPFPLPYHEIWARDSETLTLI